MKNLKKVIPSILVINLLLSLFLFVSNVSVAAAASTNSLINVKLSAYLGNVSTVTASITGNYKVANDGLTLNGSYQIKVESGQLVLYKNGLKQKNYGSSFTVEPEVYNTQNVIILNGRQYLGTMRFEVEGSKYVRPYNTLPVEDYLKGVVSQEMSPSWGSSGGMEALKAQAIAARTYAQGVSPIDDGQTDQVYTGYYWYENTNRAIEETQGLVLKYNGQVIGANALYSSSNGGKILSKVNSWGDASWNRVPYLQVKDDPYDAKSAALGNANIDWKFSINKTQMDLSTVDLNNPAAWWTTKKENSADTTILNNMKNWLQANGHIDKKYEVKIVGFPELSFDTNVPSNLTINGHMKVEYLLRDTATNSFVMENGSIKVHSKTIDTRAYIFRTMIGSTFMKGPYIKSVQDDGTKYTVNGGGWGHGIGMSQFGAYQMSKEGKTVKEILNFYYPGTTIDDVLGPTVSNLQSTVDDKGVVTFSYALDEESTTNVTLSNPQKSILSNKVQARGNVQFTWDANSLSAGTYTFTIVTKDKNGNSAQYVNSFQIAEKPVDEGDKIKVTLTESKTYLYDGPNGEGKSTQYLSPQTVYATSQVGQWYQIDTWLGVKWITVQEVATPEDTSSTTDVSKITILDKTNLYSSPSTNQTPSSSVSPQMVTVIEQNGDWFKIKTWIGDKWIKPARYSVAVSKKMSVVVRTNLYNNPTTSEKVVSTISPQSVNVIAEIPNTGWYQINTWLGPKWIQVAGPKQSVNITLTLKSRTDIYNSPDLSIKPFSTLSPQSVKAISKLGNTDWYEINTWVGPKWIYMN
ncbi:SpoIID/LytB domain-containing protein [Robertmurraya massiliosenegalensis]|uniref:SpoIID/LytB domain-containing protein n=1 Tax=Robertmurraya TaxID=2837507 RepID=UPI0039A5C726